MMNDRPYRRLLSLFLFALILCQALFAALPGIDLAVSGLFANGSAGFPWAGTVLTPINFLIRRTGELVALALVLWCLVGGLTGVLRGADLRAWSFAALTVLLASGVIVNMILKEHVGRARPADILPFGGPGQFTPAWQITDQCASNCSFTSGEVSLAASLSIVAVVLLWPRLRTLGAKSAAFFLAALYVGIVSVLRIGLGRHFLSDAVFSFLFSAATALALYPLLRIGTARQTFRPELPVEVLIRYARKGHAFARSRLKRQG